MERGSTTSPAARQVRLVSLATPTSQFSGSDPTAQTTVSTGISWSRPSVISTAASRLTSSTRVFSNSLPFRSNLLWR